MSRDRRRHAGISRLEAENESQSGSGEAESHRIAAGHAGASSAYGAFAHAGVVALDIRADLSALMDEHVARNGHDSPVDNVIRWVEDIRVE